MDSPVRAWQDNTIRTILLYHTPYSGANTVMWQALKALWGKIAGQAPPVPAAAPIRKPVPSSPQEARPPLRNDSAAQVTTPVPQPPAQPATPGDPLSRLADPASPSPNKAWDAFSAIAAAEDTRKKEASGLESDKPAEDPTDDFMQMLVGKRPALSEETPELESVSEIIPPTQPAEKPADLQMGGGFPKVMQSPILPAQPTPTAESINSFGAKSDIGSRISSIASSTDSGRAVSSISTTRLRQPE